MKIKCESTRVLDRFPKLKVVAKQVAQMPEDQKRQGGACWKFKTRSGWGDYTPEKSAEVEQHYQEWVAAGKPSAGASLFGRVRNYIVLDGVLHLAGEDVLVLVASSEASRLPRPSG